MTDPNWEYDFIDFPTGWWLAARVDHNPGCSYRVTNGAFLCDDNANCHTIRTEWGRRKRERDFSDTPPKARPVEAAATEAMEMP